MRIHLSKLSSFSSSSPPRVWKPSRRAAAAARRGATNDFYRFNYSPEEMQPIKYPAQPIATQHQITLHGETIQYTARVGFMPIRPGHQRRHRGPSLLRLLFEERRHR